MKRWAFALGLLASFTLAAEPASAWAIRRAANLPDGAPAFEILNPRGEVVSRVECIFDGWYSADEMAARFMSAPGVMAAVIAKAGRLAIEDLGPARFNCAVSAPAL